MVTNAVDAETTRSDDSGEHTHSSTAAESDPTAAFSVTVYLRTSPTGAAARRQQAVLERLRELEAEGVVPELTIERWGSRVTVPVADDDRDDAGTVAVYEEFERAAERDGLQLEPFFESRQAVGGLLSSGPPAERIIVFPVVSITIRRNGDLTGLYPCWNEGTHQSIEDCLGALASADSVENLE